MQQVRETREIDSRGFDFQATASLSIGAECPGEDFVFGSVEKGIQGNFKSQWSPIFFERLQSKTKRGGN